MRTTRIRQIIMTMIAALSLTSCEYSLPDGEWDPMDWQAEVETNWQNSAFVIDAKGGEFVASCSNYSKPWLSDAFTGGEYIKPRYEGEVCDFQKITADWFKAEIKDNILTVTFDSNNTNDVRPLKLTVTAGDIFYTFTFRQSASK